MVAWKTNMVGLCCMTPERKHLKENSKDMFQGDSDAVIISRANSFSNVRCAIKQSYFAIHSRPGLLQLFIFIYGSYSIAWFRLIDWIVVTRLHPSDPSFFSSSQAVFVRCCVGCLLASALDSALAWSVAPALGSRLWCPARPDLGGCNGHQSDLMIQNFSEF